MLDQVLAGAVQTVLDFVTLHRLAFESLDGWAGVMPGFSGTNGATNALITGNDEW